VVEPKDRKTVAAKDPRNLELTPAWRETREEFLATGNAVRAQDALTYARDGLARDAWRAVIEPAFPQFAAMLATGAYARRETFPHAGLDILLLLESPRQAESLKNLLPEFVRILWDAGLRVNCTALAVDGCLDALERASTAGLQLLNRRYLAGDGALHQKLESRLQSALPANRQKLAEQLFELARARHARFQNTPYHAEPDIRDAPGTLQDIRLIEWLLALKPDPEGRAHELAEARQLIARTRCFAHYHAGSDRNVLDVETQEILVAQPFNKGQTVAQWMRFYYESARAVYNEARRAIEAAEKSHSKLLENFREYRSRLSNQEFTVSRDRLFLRNPTKLAGEPGLVFQTLEFIARHGVSPASDTERRLEAARDVFAAYCVQPQPLWDLLKPILAGPDAGMALRVMEATGLLHAILPGWSAIEYLLGADAEHRYTTGELTLRAVERFTDLRHPHAPDRRFAELASQIDDPALLLFAILFLDMGRDGPDPLRLATERARADTSRMQMPADVQATVEFLIEHQAGLTDAMTGRDLDDPDTAHFLAGRVGTMERLKLLTVMSYARIAVDSADAKLPWRLDQLWRAYSVTQHELLRELETGRIQEIPENLRDTADFIKGFPLRYLRARSTAEIASHLELFELSRPTGVAVRLEPVESAWRLTVVARDKRFLFASFAAAISSFGMDILKAEAYANAGGVILDTFVFADPKRMLQLNPSEADRLTDMIQRIALGKTDAQRLMRGRVAEPGKRAGTPEVKFDSEACPTATLVEISTVDRPGLLYSLATVFSLNSCNIDVVMVDTKGHRAIDVFYVAYDGRKLSAEMQERLKEKLIAAC
jgi:[protein-PII] uridylyltransferase